MMLVRSTILMPLSAPGMPLFLLPLQRDCHPLDWPSSLSKLLGKQVEDAMEVRSQMRSAALYNARREAVVAGGRRLSFAEAWERGVRLANGLLALGLQPQDRVGVLEDNTLESSDFFLGCAVANLVRVPLYPRNARESHLHMLGHTGCRAVVVTEKYA